MNRFLTVNFHGTSLLLVDRDGQPFVAMKQVVEGMDLDWEGQRQRLQRDRARWGACVMQVPSISGTQDTLVLPLRKLHGWLSTIQAARLRAELRDRVLLYQNECDEVLNDYWTKGMAVNARAIQAIADQRPRLSGAFIARTRDQVGHEGTNAVLERIWPEWFANLPGKRPVPPLEVVTPTLGLTSEQFQPVTFEIRPVPARRTQDVSVMGLPLEEVVALERLPAPSVSAPVKSTRAAINEAVKQFAAREGASHHCVWHLLYGEVLSRLRVNLRLRGDNRGKPPLDVAEEDGLIEQVYAIAIDVFGKAV